MKRNVATTASREYFIPYHNHIINRDISSFTRVTKKMLVIFIHAVVCSSLYIALIIKHQKRVESSKYSRNSWQKCIYAKSILIFYPMKLSPCIPRCHCDITRDKYERWNSFDIFVLLQAFDQRQTRRNKQTEKRHLTELLGSLELVKKRNVSALCMVNVIKLGRQSSDNFGPVITLQN